MCITFVMHKLRTTNSAGRIFKSDKDYLNILNICEEEADETYFWLDLLIACRLVTPDIVKHLIREANALTAIMAASCIT